MQINVSYDASTTSLFATFPAFQASFEGAINYVVNLYDNLFANNVQVNIVVGYGENPKDGSSLPSYDNADNFANTVNSDYSHVKAALIANANFTNNPIQLAAVGTLPNFDLSEGNGDTFEIPTAEARVLGPNITGSGVNSTTVDGWIGFSNTVNWSFTPNATPTSNETILSPPRNMKFPRSWGGFRSPIIPQESWTCGAITRWTSSKLGPRWA